MKYVVGFEPEPVDAPAGQLPSGAVEDAEAATSWYAQRSERAAERFVAELDWLVNAIASEPARFSKLGSGVRRALLQRFPYSVVFRASDEAIEILAVAHAKRRPRFWRSRLSN